MMQSHFILYRLHSSENAGKALDSANVLLFPITVHIFGIYFCTTRSQAVFSQMSIFRFIYFTTTHMDIPIFIQNLMAYVAISTFCVCLFCSIGQRNLS